jgi:hypothetical protein
MLAKHRKVPDLGDRRMPLGAGLRVAGLHPHGHSRLLRHLQGTGLRRRLRKRQRVSLAVLRRLQVRSGQRRRPVLRGTLVRGWLQRQRLPGGDMHVQQCLDRHHQRIAEWELQQRLRLESRQQRRAGVNPGWRLCVRRVRPAPDGSARLTSTHATDVLLPRARAHRSLRHSPSHSETASTGTGSTGSSTQTGRRTAWMLVERTASSPSHCSSLVSCTGRSSRPKSTRPAFTKNTNAGTTFSDPIPGVWTVRYEVDCGPTARAVVILDTASLVFTANV